METKNSPLSAVHVQHRPKKTTGPTHFVLADYELQCTLSTKDYDCAGGSRSYSSVPIRALSNLRLLVLVLERV